jgi:histidinol phosphatase-like enzyme (inositol monophosphatase family)
MSDSQSLTAAETKSIIDTANAMADAAREVILPRFRSNTLIAENKSLHSFDPVTDADKDAEKVMISELKKRRPTDGVFGEEFGELNGESLYRWVLDPIDGTRAFIAGAPTWGVLISLEKLGAGPIFGIIDQPYIGERFFGGLGLAEYKRRDESIELLTSNVDEIENAILLSTFPEIGTEKDRKAFERVSENVKLTRYGLDCYGYALVAMGTADLVIEAGLSTYDIQAPACVIEAAGGVVTDWDGKTVINDGRIIAASNEKLHKKALERLNS